MTHSTRFTLITVLLLMSVLALGLLAGCDEHRMQCRRDGYYDLHRHQYDRVPRRYAGGFRPPPPRPVRRYHEDRDDFEDRMDDWEDDYDDWKDDYDDWKDDYEDWREDRREAHKDRYHR